MTPVILKTQAHWQGNSAMLRFGIIIIMPFFPDFQLSLRLGRPSRVTFVDAEGLGAARFRTPLAGHSREMA